MHYVPLSYSAADVVSKIEWLKKNDKMAQQIAENARNFGRSYLRLEDQFCYVATALETFAALVEGTDATSAWDPKLIGNVNARMLFDERRAKEEAAAASESGDSLVEIKRSNDISSNSSSSSSSSGSANKERSSMFKTRSTSNDLKTRSTSGTLCEG